MRPWDAWLQQVMAGSRERMGNDWLPAYLESPVWRFMLPGGMCGAGAVLGLLMPSVDRVGRYFPLTLAAVFPPGAGVPAADAAGRWLEVCETAGRAALDADVPPDEVARQVAGQVPGRVPGQVPGQVPSGALPLPGAGDAVETPGSAVWWTDGGPRVAATRLALAALPDATQFAVMLDTGMLGAGTLDAGLLGAGTLGAGLGAGAPAREEA